jgi:hypothetical protein
MVQCGAAIASNAGSNSENFRGKVCWQIFDTLSFSGPIMEVLHFLRLNEVVNFPIFSFCLRLNFSLFPKFASRFFIHITLLSLNRQDLLLSARSHIFFIDITKLQGIPLRQISMIRFCATVSFH